jgi:hypothetical protein
MVAGYHLIWTAYGYWLPNDPRGSTSREVRVEAIQSLGELHFGRRKVQPSSSELRAFFAKARDALAHPVLTFDDTDIDCIATTIGREIETRGYMCYACAGAFSTRGATSSVKLSTSARIPLKIGRPEQRWDFVQKYEGWLPRYRA